MAKLPPGLREAQSQVASLTSRRQAILSQHHDRSQSESPTQQPPKPHHFPKKFSRENPSGNRTAIAAAPRNYNPPAVNFRSPSLSDAKSLFKSIIASNSAATTDVKYLNSFLSSFAAVSSLDDSIALVYHMSKSYPLFVPDRSTYHVLLIQSCKAPEPTLSSVRKTLNLMADGGFPPDKATTDIAVRALCTSDRLDHAVELVKEMCLKSLPPDSYTYNYILKQLCRSRTVSTVNNFIKELRESFNVKPDLISYTILIDNVCNMKNLREATRLLQLLGEDGFKPDAYVYNIIMNGFCMLSQGNEVLWVYYKMREEKVEPDMVTFNTLIFGLSKSGKVKEAKKYLDVMAEMGHFPDEITYTSLMNGMCREGNALGALHLLGDMEGKGCTPNSRTYNTMLHGLCKAKLLGKAIEFFDTMKARNMKLETGSYGTFLRALCRNGRIAEAYEVFDYAMESKSLTDVTAYSTLESTLKWLEKAREQGLAV